MTSTLKIFVIIMSVNSLTIVKVNSSGRSLSPDSPRLHRSSVNVNPTNDQYTTGSPRPRSFTNVHSLDGASSSDAQTPRSKRRPIFQIMEDERIYEIKYNRYNPFDEEKIIAHNCFKQIKLFCGALNKTVNSEQCAKGGLLYYKGSFTNLEDAVHYFFGEFPLIAGSIILPKDYCDGKDHRCIGDLWNYRGYVKNAQDDTERAIASALRESQQAIAKYALLHRSLLGIDPNSFEIDYLIHISDRVTSINMAHIPDIFCDRLQKQHDNQA